MFITKLTLNSERIATRKFFASPEVVHAAVLKSFSQQALEESTSLGRPLWRLENKRDLILYISAPMLPDCSHIVEQAGRPNDPAGCITKSYANLLDEIHVGNRYLFRLKANPVVTIKGKRVPHRTPAFKKQWLLTRAVQNGFEIQPEHFDSGNDELLDFRKGGHRVQISTSIFEGLLTVTDVTALQQALRFGIGHQKAYGLGMLSLGRLPA